MSGQTLVSVQFHGHELYLIEHDRQPHVVMRPIVEALGLDWNGQYQRIKRHPVLGGSVCMTHTQMPGDDQNREMVALPLPMLNGWLFGVDVSRVRAELRETLIAYQRECFDVLYRHWHGDAKQQAPVSFPRRGEADAVVDANRMFQAYMRTAGSFKLPLHRIARLANERVRSRSGIDIMADLGVDPLELAPSSGTVPRAVSTRAASDPWRAVVEQWCADQQETNAALVLAGTKLADPLDKAALWRVGIIMTDLGYNPQRHTIQTPSGRIWVRGRATSGRFAGCGTSHGNQSGEPHE